MLYLESGGELSVRVTVCVRLWVCGREKWWRMGVGEDPGKG